MIIEKLKKYFMIKKDNVESSTNSIPYTRVLRKIETDEPENIFKPSSSTDLFDITKEYIENNLKELIHVEDGAGSDVRYSIKKSALVQRLEIIDDELVLVESNEETPTFSNEVKRIMKEKGIDSVTLCNRILMDRRLFSKLNTDVLYQPSKMTAVSLCFGLQLSYKESLVLLNRAGYSLSEYIKFDVLTTFLLKNGIYDINMINELLYKYDLKCIGTE